MSTATLRRPALRIVSLPADATWTQPQRPTHVIPCQTRPATWWDTGNQRNEDAIKLCGTCPMQAACKPAEDEHVAGTIRAGVAYDDFGNLATLCAACGLPTLRRHGNPVCVNGHGTVASYHDQIAAMRAQRKSFEQIGAALGVSASAVNRYWAQHLNRTGAREVRLTRLPGVAADATGNKPQDYHDQIIAMLSDLNAAWTYEEVAYAIGATTDAVKGYWRRWQQQLARLGLPTVDRRAVCNRGGRHPKRKAEAVAA